MIELSQEVRHSLDEQKAKLAGIEPPANLHTETRAAIKQAVVDSFVSGFRVVMLVSAGLALASGLSAWVMIEGKTAPGKVRAVVQSAA
jgi:hypothetical protein